MKKSNRSYYRCGIFFITLLNTLSAWAKIHIVCTAALLNKQARYREQEYRLSMRIIQKLGYTPYVIEACKKHGPTFFEKYTPHVFYSTMNNPALHNKGVNEGKTMLEGLKAFHFADDDIIIKLTGRYHFISDYLINLIKKNPSIDAFVLCSPRFNAITGCFAMRYKHLIAMLEGFDYETMETTMSCIEWECATFVNNGDQKGILKVMYLDKLDVRGKMFCTGITDLNYIPFSTW